MILVFQDNWKQNPDWLEKLIDTHLRFCVSPLHDKDKWSKLDAEKHPDRAEYIMQHIDEPKTPHYHVMIHCDDNTTFKTMKEITLQIGLPIPLPVAAPDGMYSYFTHEFNKDKAQYDPNDIRHYNGSDPSDYLMEISKKKKSDMMLELSLYFREKLVSKYTDMQLIAAYQYKNPNYLYIVQSNAFFFKQIIADNVSDKKRIAREIDKRVIEDVDDAVLSSD